MDTQHPVDRQTPRHPIRVVVHRTGLQPALIRAWKWSCDTAALLVGGRSADAYTSHLEAIQARRVEDLGPLQGEMEALRQGT